MTGVVSSLTHFSILGNSIEIDLKNLVLNSSEVIWVIGYSYIVAVVVMFCNIFVVIASRCFVVGQCLFLQHESVSIMNII